MTTGAAAFVETRDQRDDWIRAVFADKRFLPPRKVCAAGLALYRGPSGDVFPSLATLAHKVGQSKRSVIRHVQGLVDARVLVADKSTGKRSEYHFVQFKAVTIVGTSAEVVSPVPNESGAKSSVAPVPKPDESGDTRCHSESTNPKDESKTGAPSRGHVAAPAAPTTTSALFEARLRKHVDAKWSEWPCFKDANISIESDGRWRIVARSTFYAERIANPKIASRLDSAFPEGWTAVAGYAAPRKAQAEARAA